MILGLFINYFTAVSQVLTVAGKVTDGVVPLEGVAIHDLERGTFLAKSNRNGMFLLNFVCKDNTTISIVSFSKTGYQIQNINIHCSERDSVWLEVVLPHVGKDLEEVVVTSTLLPIAKSHSAIPVAVLNSSVFQRISSPLLMDALPVMPGVRLHYDCSVCEAPSLRFNGLPGPYTLLVIDGMPMVGALASTYGLYGLPSSMIQRVEVTRGPGSVLYGTEALGGVVNVLTLSPDAAPKVSAEQLLTSWGEVTSQLTSAYRLGKGKMLTGVYHHYYNNRIDRNSDNFLDLPLQIRLSVFQKIQYSDQFEMWLRYYYEDRLGGSLNGKHCHRHSREEYVESIFTNRAEWMMKYSSRVIKPLQMWWSNASHWQNSLYGENHFFAKQYLSNLQTLWHDQVGKIGYTLGTSLRYQYYNDNTTATSVTSDLNGEADAPDILWMPAALADVSLQFNELSAIISTRIDHHPIHRFVPTGRIGAMYQIGSHTFRATHGSAFRVVNLFAEEHAALTGAREVVIVSQLRPERALGQIAEWEYKKLTPHFSLKSTITAFSNYFTNRILPDYDTNPQKIIFKNLEGVLMHKGVNFQLECGFNSKWDFTLSGALQDMNLIEEGKKELPPFVERINFQSLVGYSFGKNRFDLSSNTYSPMRLPLAGELDPRPKFSPWFTHLHLQYSYRSEHGFSLTFGIKNLLDFVPWRGLPFLIARAHDPFDKRVEFDAEGVPIPTADNPYALTFDPGYAFTSLQGRRFFIQWTYKL
ncbi:TonB-dependent receptor plug domain-containing protein [Thermaurantimonas sp.]|uniref:TonB-dependent receptor n=1 Tax=Thermaurantimonas sp. TaxID=2681568 RepID=UPI00391A6038